jgi:hypothetical protein
MLYLLIDSYGGGGGGGGGWCNIGIFNGMWVLKRGGG